MNDNQTAINALFNAKADASVQIITVTVTPVIEKVVTKYEMGEVEIAVIVVACLIFLGSFIAILLVMRAWKK